MKFHYCLVLCLLAFVGTLGQECVQDFECDNLPFTVCHGGVNDCSATVKGLAVDETTKQIYFAQICKGTAKASNITLKQVSASGGVPTAVDSHEQVSSAENSNGFYDTVGDYMYFSLQSKTPGYILTTRNVKTHAQSSVDTGAYFMGAIDFDVTGRKTYVCNNNMGETTGSYTIDSFNGILGQDATTRTTLYTISLNQACTAVRVLGNDIYFTTVDIIEGSSSVVSKVYKGSATCAACTTPATLLFSTNSKISDFDVTASGIYYATAKGVYSSDFAGDNVDQISHCQGASGIRILSDRVYWNSGSAVVSANLNGRGVQQVNQIQGKCGCRAGFSGAKCNQCEGGQVQMLQGVPSCVSMTAGNPSTCNFDYECANYPFSVCSASSCQCRSGFSGAQCSQCAGTVTWSGTTPTCVSQSAAN